MLRMFRSATLLYFGPIVLGALILSPFCATLTINGEKIFPLGIKPMHPVLALLILIIIIFASWVIATKYAAKLDNKILKIYTEECDPYTYISRYENILKRRLGNERPFVLMYLSAGYLAIENAEKAKQILDSIKSFPYYIIRNVVNRFNFYNALCSYYLQVNDIPNAEKMLENMLSSLQNEKFPKLRYDETYNYYTDKQYSINVAKGVFSGAEEVFSIRYNREKSKLGKVVAKYQLGKIYMYYERFEEAKEAFEYVINNGNKTYYVGKSIEFLNQCKVGEPT